MKGSSRNCAPLLIALMLAGCGMGAVRESPAPVEDRGARAEAVPRAGEPAETPADKPRAGAPPSAASELLLAEAETR
jgi:hypothetical protein